MALLRWQQAEGKRHAIKLVNAFHADVDTPFIALCGVSVTPHCQDFSELGGIWLDPTCAGCLTAWLGMKVSSTGVLV
jgi:hypothetical protein